MMNIFLSRPTWMEEKFKDGFEVFNTIIESMGFIPRTLGVTDYPSRAPLDEVIELMSSCKGAIIMGYPQIEVFSGQVKSKDVKNLILPTEWNHIEAALAYSLSIPLLVIHHTGVSRGIFDRGTISSFIYEKDLSITNWAIEKDIKGAIENWKMKCLSTETTNAIGRSGDSAGNENLCPNCSKGSSKFYMSPIPSDFIIIEKATHECTKCGYKR